MNTSKNMTFIDQEPESHITNHISSPSNTGPDMDSLLAIINKLSEGGLFSFRTLTLIRHDLLRLRTRLKQNNKQQLAPLSTKLHLGSGSRNVKGWLNVDIENSDYDIDLAEGRLPWKDDVFSCLVSQHFIEHLDFLTEFMPLLREIHRVLKTGGEVWLSCPDIEKICLSYINHNMSDILADSKSRWPNFSLGDIPSTYMINHIFHQNGEHKNLFDFKLLKWALGIHGFMNIERVEESDLLNHFPEFPPRRDDLQSIYVRAINS